MELSIVLSWYAEQTVFNGCFVEAPVFHVKIWNRPIETTIYTWIFGVPGAHMCFLSVGILKHTFEVCDMGSQNSSDAFPSERRVFFLNSGVILEGNPNI